MNERRRAKRLDLQGIIIMNRVDPNVTQRVSIDIIDISNSGIGFICDEKLDMGAVYETDLKIWTGDTIHAFIEIVRVSEEVGGGIFGGLFIGMPESDWCRIRVYETYQEYQEKE
ncbi:MAG: PilZ domain-containing protein [Lachnospiraceae bacterium]|nr:PilZ domain-containing protein [Lachnospiraceae bacterium]